MKPFSVFITSDDEDDNLHREVQLQCYDFTLKKNNSPPVENILLLHCNGINCLAYKAVVEHLVVSCNCRVVTFDQRGHGMSKFTKRKKTEEVLNDDDGEKMMRARTKRRGEDEGSTREVMVTFCCEEKQGDAPLSGCGKCHVQNEVL